jgi:4'-phosphopantetheinyl transferase
MPIQFKSSSNGTSVLVWHITEPVQFFLSALRLTAFDTERFAQLKTDERRLEFLVPRYLFRLHTGVEPDWHFETTGRPRPFGGLHFSVSHCRDFAAIAVNPQQHTGIDVEIISVRAGRVAQKFLGSTETIFATDDAHTTLLWSAKETLFKMCVNQGIDFKSQLLVENIPGGNSGMLPCKIKKAEKTVHAELEFRIFDKNVIVWGAIDESI